MPRKRKPTKDQHYITLEYLRGFSPNGRYVLEFGIKENKQNQKPISIKDIGKKKYLYEYRDNDGNIIDLNKIELELGKIDSILSKYRGQLEKKALCKDNIGTPDFFDSSEIDFWKMFASVQALRFPDILQTFTDKLLKQSDGQLTKNEARNLILNDTVSAESFMNPNAQSTYSFIYDIFRDLYMSLFVDESESLFANNRVLSFGQTEKATKPNMVLLPITSKMVIVFYDDEHEPDLGKNNLHNFTPEELDNYKRCTTTNAEWIYSRKPLSDRDIQILNERKMNT